MELDSLRPQREALLEQVLRGPGTVSREIREAAAAGTGLPPEWAAFVEKIHRHAYKVTDEEVAALRARYGDDAVFEIIVAASLGAADQRFQAGMRALEEAARAKEEAA
jgi:hypothetical protein